MIRFSMVRLLALSTLLTCTLASGLLAMECEGGSIEKKGFGGCTMPRPITNYYFAPVEPSNTAWPYKVEAASPNFTKVFVEQYGEVSGTFFLETVNDTTVLFHSLQPGRFGMGGIFFDLYKTLKNRHPNLTTIYANVMTTSEETRKSLVEWQGFEETAVHPSSYIKAKYQSEGYVGYKKTL